MVFLTIQHEKIVTLCLEGFSPATNIAIEDVLVLNSKVLLRYAKRSALANTSLPHSFVCHELNNLGSSYYQAHFILAGQDIIISVPGTTVAERRRKSSNWQLTNMPATHKRGLQHRNQCAA